MRRLPTTAALLAVALVAASAADGAIEQQGNLRLKFSTKLTPKKLPRARLAPVSVRVHGEIGTADGRRPPQLTRIEFAFNRNGRVSTKGLPFCEPGDLEGTTSAGAREACGPATVGKGRFKAFVDIAGRRPVPFDGDALAFNGRVSDKPAVLLHIYGSSPTRVTFVIPFLIHHVKKGEFGTVFIARPPKIASDVGYITELAMKLGREYSYRGQRRSFLGARCAAPAGLPGGPFALSRGEFAFETGQKLSMTITSNCWVRH